MSEAALSVVQIITFKETVEACQKLLDQGTLLAEWAARHTSPLSEVPYVWELPDGTECRCAIGAAFNDSTVDRIKKAGHNVGINIDRLLLEQFIAVPSQWDKQYLRHLQALHDKWFYSPRDRARKQAFMDFIKDKK